MSTIRMATTTTTTTPVTMTISYLDAAHVPSESLPIWSVVLPQVATTQTNGAGSAGGLRLVAGKDRVRFTDVVQSFQGWMKLLKVRTQQQYLRYQVFMFVTSIIIV